MLNNKLILHGFLFSIAVSIYIALVAWLIQNAEQVFGSMVDSLWGPIAFLMLFTLSAAIVGSLIFGRPALLFLNGQKKEALTLVLYTIGFLFVFTVLVFIGIAVI